MFRIMSHENTKAAEKSQTETTHFGFRTVNAAAKQGLVRNVFDTVARKYDLMNDVMSGGLHRLWKDEMIRVLRPQPGMKLLDVAGGTGDIAFRFLNATDRLPVQKKVAEETEATIRSSSVIVCDINENMLSVGRDRGLDRGFMDNIHWVCGDAEALPLPDNTVDAYTIAFGIRNVTHIDKALREARRVLRPGGRFLCLEFSHVDLPLLEKIYDFYSFQMIPRFGQWVAGDRDSYQYLVESIRRFPSQERFRDMIEDAGFHRVSYRNMTGGVVALHSGWRL